MTVWKQPAGSPTGRSCQGCMAGAGWGVGCALPHTTTMRFVLLAAGLLGACATAPPDPYRALPAAPPPEAVALAHPAVPTGDVALDAFLADLAASVDRQAWRAVAEAFEPEPPTPERVAAARAGAGSDEAAAVRRRRRDARALGALRRGGPLAGRLEPHPRRHLPPSHPPAGRVGARDRRRPPRRRADGAARVRRPRGRGGAVPRRRAGGLGAGRMQPSGAFPSATRPPHPDPLPCSRSLSSSPSWRSSPPSSGSAASPASRPTSPSGR